MAAAAAAAACAAAEESAVADLANHMTVLGLDSVNARVYALDAADGDADQQDADEHDRIVLMTMKEHHLPIQSSQDDEKEEREQLAAEEGRAGPPVPIKLDETLELILELQRRLDRQEIVDFLGDPDHSSLDARNLSIGQLARKFADRLIDHRRRSAKQTDIRQHMAPVNKQLPSTSPEQISSSSVALAGSASVVNINIAAAAVVAPMESEV